MATAEDPMGALPAVCDSCAVQRKTEMLEIIPLAASLAQRAEGVYVSIFKRGGGHTKAIQMLIVSRI